jgi:beta-glucosidase
VPHDRQRLASVELPPFREAVAAGVASVMTAHLLLPALDREHPATLSPAVLRGLLRQDLGFEGLVVTDALVMEAIAGRYGAGEAAVRALQAGADLVLMPADVDAAIEAILDAVADGRLTREGLEARAARRHRLLAGLPDDQGAQATAETPLGAFSNGPCEENRRLALELVRHTLVHRGGGVTACNGPPNAGDPDAAGVNLIRVDTQLSCPFLPPDAPALRRPAEHGYGARIIDGRAPSPWWDPGPGGVQASPSLERLGKGPVLLQLFVRGNPFRGSTTGADELWRDVILELQRLNRLAGLVIYGSPYLWDGMLTVLEPSIPAVWSPGQMPLAQQEVMDVLGVGSGPSGELAGLASEGEQGFTD